MRQKYFGIAIAAFATLGSATAWGGDREIAAQIITRLNESRDSGELKDFTLDMKVDKGIVLFRGNVSENAQKRIVLKAAQGIDGIAKVVDEVDITTPLAKVVKRKSMTPIAVTAPANVVSPIPVKTALVESTKAISTRLENGGAERIATETIEIAATTETAAMLDAVPAPESQPTPNQAFATTAKKMQAQNQTPAVVPGQIRRTAAYEATTDQQIVSGVITALRNAKRNGQLKGFGVDVKSHDGVLQLTGRAGSAVQRDQIVRIAESVPGVSGVREAISIPTNVNEVPSLPASQPAELQRIADSSAIPLSPPRQVVSQRRQVPAMTASAAHGLQARTAPYRMPAHQYQNAPVAAIPAGMGMGFRRGAAVAGQPVPMAPHSQVGAPRYDSPNLPNYAWPGYSAHPNYAALTYPQQYSPSAWPYIGPFYPYPQVPLGWRKISLEWDDGWWFLDFTDK